MRKLEIKNLFVEVDNKVVIKGLDLVINRGEIHVMMGPNGSGKSTLANALMGHPKYKITKGNIIIDGIDMTKKKSDSRAKAGLFLSMQNPPEVTGVSLNNFVRTSVESIKDEKINPVRLIQGLM